MSTNEDYPPTRGKRIKAIREDGEWEQDDFADRLNAAAKKLGREFEVQYDRTVISKIENGRRDVSLTDAVIAASIDPRKRGVEWIAGAAELKQLPRRERKAGNG